MWCKNCSTDSSSNEGVTFIDNDESSVKFNESSVKSSKKFGDIELNHTQKMILSMIKSDNQISATEISKHIGLSVRAIEKSIKELREKGILKRNGPARGGYWEIIG